MTLIIQPAFPSYRSSLFNRINDEFCDVEFLEIRHRNLSAIQSNTNKFSVQKADFVNKPLYGNLFLIYQLIRKHDRVILFGNLNIWQVWFIIFLTKIFRRKLLIWTQVPKKIKFNFKGFIKTFVFLICDNLYLYTDLELQRIPRFIRRKSISLNNGLDTSAISKFRKRNTHSKTRFLSVGRFTQKSGMDWLISCFEKTDYELHVIGVDEQEVGMRFDNIHLHGVLVDEEQISKIANTCTGFVYGGNVGLSLIHGMAYGLPPVIHSNIEEHMPEVAAFLELDGGYTFLKGNSEDLLRVLDSLVSNDNSVISKNCIDIVDDKYNFESMYKKFKIGLEI